MRSQPPRSAGLRRIFLSRRRSWISRHFPPARALPASFRALRVCCFRPPAPGRCVGGALLRRADEVLVFIDGNPYRLVAVDPRRPAHGSSAAAGKIVAPMPGTLTKITVASGDAVEKGAVLAIVEAMKMEHAVLAPCPGKVL